MATHVWLNSMGVSDGLEVLKKQYHAKLHGNCTELPTFHDSLLQPITPNTLPNIILPYACDACLLAEATQALNEVRIEYLA